MLQRLRAAADAVARPLQPRRVHVDHHHAGEILSLFLYEQLLQLAGSAGELTVVCVGTDRSTGDALGPLVGSKLLSSAPNGLRVHGTLDQPVHAANLADLVATLPPNGAGAPVLAVDACLGRSESVGYISLKDGALRPGTGVHKSLPAVGQLHIVGVVNVGGFMEYFVLQNTRLSLVMRMADTIARSIVLALERFRTGALANAEAASHRENEAGELPAETGEPGGVDQVGRPPESSGRSWVPDVAWPYL